MKDRGKLVRFVEVTWIDSHRQDISAWSSLAEVDKYHREPVECSTVGFLVKRDKRGVTLAMSVNDQGGVGALWHVPAGIVKRIRWLRAR